MKTNYSILSLFLLLISISVVGQTKIYAPSLRSPENTVSDQDPNVVLDWDAVTGITLDITYEAQIAGNPDFTDAVTFPRTSVTAETMSDLHFGGTYYWRVRAYDSLDVSGWSDTWSFTVVWSVSMLKPNDADDGIYSNPIITWHQLSGISSYQLQVDTSYTWNIEQSGVTSKINDSYFVDDNNMWAVGNGGLIIYNDGSGWVSVTSGTTNNLNSVFFIDNSNAYAVGDGGTVVHYDGSVWTIVDVGVETDLLGVSFSSTDNGVVVGDTGVIVVQNSGTWEYIETGDKNDLFGVDMINSSSIWACGKGKIVINYNGTEWAANIVGTKDHYAIAMIDENNGWVVGKSGKVDRWDGSSWTEDTYGTTKNLYSVSFAGNIGVAVGASGTMLTFNSIWSKATKLTSGDINGVMLMGNKGVAVGEDGFVIQKSGAGFDSPMLATYQINADSTDFALSNLRFGQTYYYRINAINATDTSLWSGVKSFTTIVAPTLTSPANSSVAGLYVRFQWHEYEGSTNYIFEIDDNDSFDQPRSFSPDNDTLWVNDLIFGQQYFWRVAAQHAEGISTWSDVWNFTTVNSISLISPIEDATEIDLRPAFFWENIAGSSGYEIWLDIDVSFSNPVMATSIKPTYQSQGLLDKNTMYYWKVRGKSGPDVSEWSPTWAFTTEGSTGINESFNVDAVSIYPNPSNGDFVLSIVSYNDNDYNVSIIDIMGKLIFSSQHNCKVGNNNISMSVDNLIGGTYSIIISDGLKTVTKKLVIK